MPTRVVRLAVLITSSAAMVGASVAWAADPQFNRGDEPAMTAAIVGISTGAAGDLHVLDPTLGTEIVMPPPELWMSGEYTRGS
jgi:hypothetical protein